MTIGRDGWLYYAPGLRYLFGQPFLLDADYLKAKAKGMIDKDGLAVAHPDPLPAFRQLAEDCKRLGIQLVVAPVQNKGMLIGTAQNADFGKFRAAVEGYGATVLPIEQWVEAGTRGRGICGRTRTGRRDLSTGWRGGWRIHCAGKFGRRRRRCTGCGRLR